MVLPKKKYGQHFLVDDNIARKIVNSLDYETSATILEVGPGTGVLSKFLLEKSNTIYHVEIDEEAVEYLTANLHGVEEKIIHEDFLKIDLDTLFKGELAIIGNFPYNISSQIFFKILNHVDKVTEVVGMLQYEVARRISSPPGNKQYGILSVLLQAYFDIEFLFKVEPHLFFPPPKVKSAVVRLKRKPNYQATLPCDKKLFKKIVKTAFNQRRKMLKNSLKGLEGGGELQDEIMMKRPEQLSVEEFVYLTRLFST